MTPSKTTRAAASSIYEAVIQSGAPITLPEPWHEIPCSPAFFRLPADLEKLREDLAAKFPMDELMAAGVFQIDPDKPGSRPILIQPLREPSALAWALRAQSNSPPYDLIVGMRCVAPWGCSILAPLWDHHRSSQITTVKDVVLLVFEMVDLAILWSLGLCALPGVDCWQLTPLQDELVRDGLGLEKPPRLVQSPGSPPPHCRTGPLTIDVTSSTAAADGGPLLMLHELEPDLKLFISRWSPADFAGTNLSAAGLLAEQFTELLRCHKRFVNQCYFTEASPDRLEILRTRLKFLPPGRIGACVFEMLGGNISSVPRVQSEPAPADLSGAALRRYLQSLGSGTANRQSESGGRLAKLREHVLELTDRRLIDPLLALGEFSSEPLRRVQIAICAAAVREFQDLKLSILERATQGRRRGEAGFIDSGELDALISLSTAVLGPVKALTRQPKPRRTGPARRRGLKPRTAASAPKLPSRRGGDELAAGLARESEPMPNAPHFRPEETAVDQADVLKQRFLLLKRAFGFS